MCSPRADTEVCPYNTRLWTRRFFNRLRLRSRLGDDVIPPLLQIEGDLPVKAHPNEDGSLQCIRGKRAT